MRSLREFLGTSIDVSDETLILLRLMGRPFGRPVNVDIGEEPADTLCSYLREASVTGEPGATTPFLDLIGKLLDPGFPPKIVDAGALETMFARLKSEDRAAFAFQLVRLIENSGAAVDSEIVRALNERFAPGPQITGPALSAFWHLLLSRYSVKVVPDDLIAVSRKTILDPAFIGGPIVATASQRPYLFFGTIVPILFGAIRERAADPRTLSTIPSAMRAGFSALYREPVDASRRLSHLRLFASQLEELLASGTGNTIIEAALDGAAHAACQARPNRGGKHPAAMPFAELAQLEAGASRGRARADQISSTRREALDQVLERYIAPIRKSLKQSKAEAIDPALVTNFIPYFEGTYLRIWQSLLQEAGLSIEMREHSWETVVPKLLEGELSFAIWNDYVPPQYAKGDSAIYRTNQPLLEYKNYPLVMRRDALERIIAQNLPREEANAIVGALTRNLPIPPSKFEICSELRAALRSHKLGLVENSEIEEVALRTLGKGFKRRPMESDQAVEALVNGQIDGAFVGGVQAYYLTQRFGHSVVTLTELQRSTHMHLWFNEPTFVKREYARFVRPLLQAWQATFDIWEDAHDPSTQGHRLLRDWILGLASQLNYGVSGSEWGMRTPLSSWKMISRLSRHHNDLRQPDEVLLQKALSAEEFKLDATAGAVKLVVLREAANDKHAEQRQAH